MKPFRLTMTALATAAIAITASSAPAVLAQVNGASSAPIQLAQASQFGMEETDQAPYILSTNPTSRIGGVQRYGLMIIEQKVAQPPCFSTVGSNPTIVLPLLSQLPDFSGICGRSTDTNGYLIRAAGSDIKYDPVIEAENGVLVLYAKPTPFAGPGAQKFIIGQTDGVSPSGYTKIFLRPGWRLTRQTLASNNSRTGRTYLANDSTVAQLIQESGSGPVVQVPTPTPTPTPTTPPTPAPASFPDVAGDIYASQINRAVQLGFISGFAEDNTFRPRASITREQLVSIVVEGLGVAPQGTVAVSPYPDVPANRWSAAKIKTAKDLGIISGYEDGTFKATQPVTRAELMAIMRRAAEYKDKTTMLVPDQTPKTFSDTQGHWAQRVITDMSAYCGIATALNESGSSFAPNTPAQRNYAAAAMVRLLDCARTAPGT